MLNYDAVRDILSNHAIDVLVTFADADKKFPNKQDAKAIIDHLQGKVFIHKMNGNQDTVNLLNDAINSIQYHSLNNN